jgi:hypothetical protein
MCGLEMRDIFVGALARGEGDLKKQSPSNYSK